MTERRDEPNRGSILFWVVVAAAGLYLVTRAIQGVAWVIELF